MTVELPEDTRSEYEMRFAAAVVETKLAGIWFNNAIPPYVRILRRLGNEPRLPHYVPFRSMFIASSSAFALAWGTIMAIFIWDTGEMPLFQIVAFSMIAGFPFGLIMAGYYAYGRKAYGLSRWEDLSLDE